MISREIGKIPDLQSGSGIFGFSCWAGWSAGGLVVAAGVEGEGAEDLAGGGIDDADVEVVDENEDVGSGVGPSDADVEQRAVVAQGDGA